MKNVLVCILVALLIAPASAFAALDVRTIYHLNASATANNVNGGGFDPFASTANMITDLACTLGTSAAPDCTSATYTFIAADASTESWIYIVSGTGFTSKTFCKIGSVSGGHAILSAGPGACNVLTDAGGLTGVQWGTNAAAGVGGASPTGGTFTIDRSRSTAAAETTTAATNTAGVITVGTLTFNKTYIGNLAQVVAGTSATQGWYEITNSVLATSFTLDRDPGGTVNLSINIGGAFPLNSTTANRTDDSVMELGSGTNGTGASVYWVKAGTYTVATAISISASGGTKAPTRIIGYSAIEGDTPTGTSRPTINAAALSFVHTGTNLNVSNLIIPITTAQGFGQGASDVTTNVKVINASPTANRNGISCGAGGIIENSEIGSYRGLGITASGTACTAIGNWIHSSDVLFNNGGVTSQAITLINNVFDSFVTAGVTTAGGAQTGRMWMQNNTFLGSGVTATGVCVNLITGSTNVAVFDNILTNCVTGVTHADAQDVGFDDYSDYFGNTSDVSNWVKGPNDLAVTPSYASVGEASGATATTTAGNHLVQTGAFGNVVAGRDYVYIVSGTGVTAGFYGIASVDSADQITTDIALTANATADKVFRITTGHNFLPTATLNGFPGAFQGGYTTGALGMGAAQRSSSGTSGPGRCIGCD